ncbi:MAG: class I SAM-dependent methyltransferase, partial [Rudaea sp.]
MTAQEDRARWNERYATGSGPTHLNERLAEYLHLLKRGRALDLAGGIGQNDALLHEWQVILTDISEEALARASGMRVQANGLELPFAPATFDTVVDTYYFEPSLDLATLLTSGGTLFFETYTVADFRYRPEFRHAPRL